jgi:hypothetical protein
MIRKQRILRTEIQTLLISKDLKLQNKNFWMVTSLHRAVLYIVAKKNSAVHSWAIPTCNSNTRFLPNRFHILWYGISKYMFRINFQITRPVILYATARWDCSVDHRETRRRYSSFGKTWGLTLQCAATSAYTHTVKPKVPCRTILQHVKDTLRYFRYWWAKFSLLRPFLLLDLDVCW